MKSTIVSFTRGRFLVIIIIAVVALATPCDTTRVAAECDPSACCCFAGGDFGVHLEQTGLTVNVSGHPILGQGCAVRR